MLFKSIEPETILKSHIKEIWVYENPDTTSHKQKIIPDGYSEIIIHYGDTYRIDITGKWETQDRYLFSNQISSFFHLENSGKSGMIGIKLFPHSFHELFGLDLAPLTDRVVSLDELTGVDFSGIKLLSDPNLNLDKRVKIINEWFTENLDNKSGTADYIPQAVNQMLSKNGLIELADVCSELKVSQRQLERSFKKVVGVTPKFFTRILRFNHIFQVMESGNQSWVQVALESGFYDQAHFIKNFKEFTGEEPSKYGFDEKNLANFFLIR